MLESLFTTTTDAAISIESALLTLFFALLVGTIISFAYLKTAQKGANTQNFSLTLILLPAVIAIIILMIGSNVARAFSLAGAFSIIRFRSAPGEPKDIAYILFTLAAGLACGVGFYGFGIIVAVILCLVMFILHATNYGGKRTNTQLLQITIPEDLDYEGTFDDILKQYTTSYVLKRVKTSALGSLYQLYYLITLEGETPKKIFLDELRCRNGNLNISLSMAADNQEF